MPVCPLLLGNDPDKNCSPGDHIIVVISPLIANLKVQTLPRSGLD